MPAADNAFDTAKHFDNKHNFNLFVEFNIWKQQEEDATMSRYVKARGNHRLQRQQSTLLMYYCNRSGRYIAKGKCLRRMKVQGTCKIGSVCPAAMFVKISSAGEYRYARFSTRMQRGIGDGRAVRASVRVSVCQMCEL